MDQHRVWETIADSFHATRRRTWTHVTAFLGQLPPGRVLDLMAGNGRHSQAAAKFGLEVVAADWSRPLTNTIPHGLDAIATDATRMAFQGDTFDACIYVAGLHGLTSAQGRMDSLVEARRVLRPGSPIQVTVWSRHAPRFENLAEGTDHVIVPWRADGHNLQRYYWLYDAPSLAADLQRAGFSDVRVEAVSIAAENDNLVATARA